MSRPHTATDWWGELIDRRGTGRVDILAKLLKVSDRTLRRWRTGEDVPRRQRVNAIRRLAGERLLSRADVPECLNAKTDTN